MLEKEFREFLQELGARIRRLRQDLDLTIEEASGRVEMHPSYWSQVERAVKMPSIQSLFKFSVALKTTVAGLLDLESTPRPDAVARELQQILKSASSKHSRTVVETARLIMALPGSRETGRSSSGSRGGS